MMRVGSEWSCSPWAIVETQVSVAFEEWEGTGRKDLKERIESRVPYICQGKQNLSAPAKHGADRVPDKQRSDVWISLRIQLGQAAHCRLCATHNQYIQLCPWSPSMDLILVHPACHSWSSLDGSHLEYS